MPDPRLARCLVFSLRSLRLAAARRAEGDLAETDSTADEITGRRPHRDLRMGRKLLVVSERAIECRSTHVVGPDA